MSVLTREKLKAWRKAKKLSQFALARKTGIDPSVISKIEGGDYEPGRAIAQRLEAATGIKATEWWPAAKVKDVA